MTTTGKYMALAILVAVSPLVTRMAAANSVAIVAANSHAGIFGPDVPDTDATAGYEFQVGPQNLLVTSLGMWDADTNAGLLVAAPVGIWDVTANTPAPIAGALLVSGTVPTGTEGTLIGEYRYVSVAPTILLAGHDYLAGAYVLDNIYHGSSFAASDVTFDTPDVSYLQRAATLGSFTAPTNLSDSTTSAWDAPNFQFTAVPEPTSLALWAVGICGLLLRRTVARG